MASIGEVYEAQRRGMVDQRYLKLGLVLFGGGVAFSFVGLLLATTSVGGHLGFDTYGARHVAGVLAGFGVPMALLGTLALFPARRRVRSTAAIGAGITILGVTLFWYAYPSDWAGYGRDLTPYVSAIYAFGVVTIGWALFSTVATFKQRNDPGGTVTLHLTPSTGQRRLLEFARAGLRHAGFGEGGWFASTTEPTTPRPDVEPEPTGVSRTDGGEGEVLSRPEPKPDPVDRYCGNCSHFTYGSNADGKLAPYCLYHDETMDDMDPCQHWEPNAS